MATSKCTLNLIPKRNPINVIAVRNVLQAEEIANSTWNLTSKKNNRCEFCNKCFIQKADLKRHIRIHTKEKLSMWLYTVRNVLQTSNRKQYIIRTLENSHGVSVSPIVDSILWSRPRVPITTITTGETHCALLLIRSTPPHTRMLMRFHTHRNLVIV